MANAKREIFSSLPKQTVHDIFDVHYGGLILSRKILATGGAGYIGSALVRKLLDLDLQVLVLDAMHFGEEPLSEVAGHPNLTVVREDFRHIEVLTRALSGVGSVVHLGGAAAPSLDPDASLADGSSGHSLGWSNHRLHQTPPMSLSCARCAALVSRHVRRTRID